MRKTLYHTWEPQEALDFSPAQPSAHFLPAWWRTGLMPDNSLSRSQEAETQASHPSPTSGAGLPVSEAASLPGSAQESW